MNVKKCLMAFIITAFFMVGNCSAMQFSQIGKTDVYCSISGEKVIIPYEQSENRNKVAVDGSRFKLDEKAQWFGVEKIDNKTSGVDNRATSSEILASSGSTEYGKYNEYVLIDTIRGDSNRFTVNIKSVNEKYQKESIGKMEFRQRNGLWCFYVALNGSESYEPVSTIGNERVISVFNICEKYSSFIRKSELDVNAEKACGYLKQGDRYYFDEKNYASAIDSYSNAIRLYPNYRDGYIRRARAYYRQGSYDESIKDFNKALELDPNYSLNSLIKGELQDAIKEKNRR